MVFAKSKAGEPLITLSYSFPRSTGEEYCLSVWSPPCSSPSSSFVNHLSTLLKYDLIPLNSGLYGASDDDADGAGDDDFRLYAGMVLCAQVVACSVDRRSVVC